MGVKLRFGSERVRASKELLLCDVGSVTEKAAVEVVGAVWKFVATETEDDGRPTSGMEGLEEVASSGGGVRGTVGEISGCERAGGGRDDGGNDRDGCR